MEPIGSIFNLDVLKIKKMDEFIHLSEQGREVDNLQKVKKCNKKCLVNRLLKFAGQGDREFSTIAKILTHPILDRKPTLTGLRHLKAILVREKLVTLSQMLENLDVSKKDIILDLVTTNGFPAAIIPIVLQKQYELADLYDVMKRMSQHGMAHKTIHQTFLHLSKSQMYDLMQKPDLIHILNCKDTQGCITFADVQRCLSST